MISPFDSERERMVHQLELWGELPHKREPQEEEKLHIRGPHDPIWKPWEDNQ